MNDSHIDPAGEHRNNTQRIGDEASMTPDHRAVIFVEDVHDALAVMREKLLDPDLAHTIAGEMFMHGYEGDLAEAATVPPIAIGAVIGHLFGECHVCAEHEVRRALANAEQADEPGQ